MSEILLVLTDTFDFAINFLENSWTDNIFQVFYKNGLFYLSNPLHIDRQIDINCTVDMGLRVSEVCFPN